MQVLVIAAHPDDEVLGCGGAMARHSAAGDKVHVVILAEGLTSRDSKRDRSTREGELSELARTASRANEILGAASLKLHDFPDNRMDSLDLLDVVKVVEEHIEHRQPSRIYTHHAGDLNVDHRIIHQAVITATRPAPGALQPELLFFEVQSSTEWTTPGSAPAFSPNWFIDIGPALQQKLKALEAYASEMRPWPHARSIQAVEHLARWRGASAGCEAAEAFQLGRKIESQ